ncbi:unnamed protein product, partial [Ectocarpus sp. 12 AP-2014]
MAQDELDAYDGSTNTELEETCASLGHFLGFMGDTAKYGKHLKLSDSVLTSCVEQGSTDMLPLMSATSFTSTWTTGFAELVYHKDTVHVQGFSGDLDTPGIDGMATRRQHPPQIKPAQNERDVFRCVVESLTGFMECVSEKVGENNSTRRQSRDGEPCDEDIRGASPHGKIPRAEKLSQAVATGLKEGLIDFDHLREA